MTVVVDDKLRGALASPGYERRRSHQDAGRRETNDKLGEIGVEVTYLKRDVGELRTDLKDVKRELGEVKSGLVSTREALNHRPTTGTLIATFTAFLALLTAIILFQERIKALL